MLQAVLQYLAVDLISSLVVGAVIYAKRNQIKVALRNYLEIPNSWPVAEEDTPEFEEDHEHVGCDCE